MALDYLGTDLQVSPTYSGTSWSNLDLTLDPAAPLPGTTQVDLAVAVGANALRQALLLRLLTPRGSLAALGHASYGSRLHDLIGRPHTEATRALARAFVLEAIAQERRVAQVLALELAPRSEAEPHHIRMELSVQPLDTTDPVTLGVQVSL